MKVLIDTNILISAALRPAGTPYEAYLKAVTYPNRGMVCEQNIDELHRVWNRKFPNKMYALETFLSRALLTLELVPTPEENAEQAEENGGCTEENGEAEGGKRRCKIQPPD